MKYVKTYSIYEGVDQEDLDRVLDKKIDGEHITRFDQFILDTFGKLKTMSDVDYVIQDILYNIYRYGDGEISSEDLELESDPVYDDYQLMEYFNVDGVMVQVYTDEWEYTEETFAVKYEELDMEMLKSIQTLINEGISKGTLEDLLEPEEDYDDDWD
jgi:hypothetical protein